jgi:DNA invertase Pin-like site-specific DNA recombinase
MTRAALYLRVSTEDQTTDNQRLELEKLADLRGWTVVQIYQDNGISGAMGRKHRPGLDQMLKDAARRRFDLVVFWSVDRLGRSTAEVTSIMAEIDALGIGQFYFKQSIDTSTPHGQAMVEMAAVFAKLERAMISERVKAGLARARAQGKRLGRPPLTIKQKNAVIHAGREGLSLRAIARRTGVSYGSVRAVLASEPSVRGQHQEPATAC